MVSPISFGAGQDPYANFYHSSYFLEGQERALCSQIQRDQTFHESAQEQTQENFPQSDPL